MVKYTDNINGYLDADGNEFAFNVANQHVTILPVQNSQNEKNIVIDQFKRNYDQLPDYFEGIDDQFFRVAIFRNPNKVIKPNIRYPSFHFMTPLIIKAAGNASGLFDKMPEPWNKFHAITFYGGNINSIYDPAISIEQPTTAEIFSGFDRNEIKFRSWKDYSKSINCNIDEEKAEFSISVLNTGDKNDPDKMEAYSLGERNSYIQLTFEKSQDFSSIKKYFNIIRKLVAILTKQNNVTFNTYLCQRNTDGLLYRTAYCYIFDPYDNYSKRRPYKVIPLDEFLFYVPEFIEKIQSNVFNPLITLLPDNNKDAYRISITNVQDLCTALEIAYGFEREKREKDQVIEALKKEIKKTIKDFLSRQEINIDINRQTNMSSSFQYLSFTLKEKIFTLYNENKEIINRITNKMRLHNLTYEDVVAFVDLRNNKTHSGIIEWGNAADYYEPLLALVYICYFKEIGISEELISNLLDNLF